MRITGDFIGVVVSDGGIRVAVWKDLTLKELLTFEKGREIKSGAMRIFMDGEVLFDHIKKSVFVEGEEINLSVWFSDHSSQEWMKGEYDLSGWNLEDVEWRDEKRVFVGIKRVLVKTARVWKSLGQVNYSWFGGSGQSILVEEHLGHE